jgi:hypothetical protein
VSRTTAAQPSSGKVKDVNLVKRGRAKRSIPTNGSPPPHSGTPDLLRFWCCFLLADLDPDPDPDPAF